MSFFSGLPSMPTFDELKARAGMSGSPAPLGQAGYVAPPPTLGGRRMRRNRKMRGGYAGVTPLLPGIYDGVSSGAAAPVAAAPVAAAPVAAAPVAAPVAAAPVAAAPVAVAAPAAPATTGGSKRRRSKSRSRGGKKSKKSKRSKSKSRQRR